MLAFINLVPFLTTHCYAFYPVFKNMQKELFLTHWTILISKPQHMDHGFQFWAIQYHRFPYNELHPRCRSDQLKTNYLFNLEKNIKQHTASQNLLTMKKIYRKIKSERIIFHLTIIKDKLQFLLRIHILFTKMKHRTHSYTQFGVWGWIDGNTCWHWHQQHGNKSYLSKIRSSNLRSIILH